MAETLAKFIDAGLTIGVIPQECDCNVCHRLRPLLAEAQEAPPLPPTPSWCEVHQHHKWCGHNGGIMGATGYEAPPLRPRTE